MARKFGKGKVAVIVAVVVAVLLFASVPIVNDWTAAQVRADLEKLPLPANTVRVDALSHAGRMTGNGNGMQYLGAILLQSDLPIEAVESHYAPFRADRWDCIVAEYDGGPLEFIDIGQLSFSAAIDAAKQYYVVYSWGSGLAFYKDVDLRGH